MRVVTIAASVLLSALLASPGLAAKSKDKKEVRATQNASPPSMQGQPTWPQCFQISLDRGFDHEYEEWRQFLDDCMAGKIPRCRRGSGWN